ncbi:MAG: sugar phosphate isomerase/epimerase [Chloroflexi bacterium]|jgi:sugar phosphate isomerase/epimerase|nr:sugar phosphate isomerase/epimerase [Chloroflexota bacterium]
MREPVKISCCWLYAISAYGYPVPVSDIPEAFERMAALGMHFVELEGASEGGNLLELQARRAEIKAVAERLGQKVVNFCPVIPELVSLDDNERERGFELFQVAVDLARYFGCATIQIDSYTPPLRFVGEQPYKDMLNYGVQFQVQVDPAFSWDRQWQVLVDTFKRCAAMARVAELPFCLEPRVGEIISNTDALLRLMDHVGAPNFGAVLDTAHQHAQKEILPLSVEKLGSRIMYLHVADNDGLVNDHKALGEGTVDWQGVFTALDKHGFSGYVAIDIGRLPDMDAAMGRSIAYLQDLLGRLDIPYLI